MGRNHNFKVLVFKTRPKNNRGSQITSHNIFESEKHTRKISENFHISWSRQENILFKDLENHNMRAWNFLLWNLEISIFSQGVCNKQIIIFVRMFSFDLPQYIYKTKKNYIITKKKSFYNTKSNCYKIPINSISSLESVYK